MFLYVFCMILYGFHMFYMFFICFYMFFIWFYMFFICFYMFFVWFYMVFIWFYMVLYDFILFLYDFWRCDLNFRMTRFFEFWTFDRKFERSTGNSDYHRNFRMTRFSEFERSTGNSNVPPEIRTNHRKFERTTEIFGWPVFLTNLGILDMNTQIKGFKFMA